jgi:mannose-6-phosphate isomerase
MIRPMRWLPITFRPKFVGKMWGGRRLHTVLDKPLPAAGDFGESWEIYDFPPGSVGADGRGPDDAPDSWISAVVDSGPLTGKTLHELMTSHARDLLGDARPVETPHGPQFPLLIKFLDAKEDLSVQVHPPESYAKSHAGAHLKNECWHVLDVVPGSRLLVGTTPGTTRESFAKSIDAGTSEALLGHVPVKIGETIYLPSGTVHALGGGVLAAEVQTPSDTTFRVFDFNRPDPKTGKPRALHVEPALECIDFDSPPPKLVPAAGRDQVVVEAPQFTMTQRVRREHDEARYDAGELRVIIATGGSGRVLCGKQTFDLPRGRTVLLPACVDAVVVPTGELRFLEVTLPTAPPGRDDH